MARKPNVRPSFLRFWLSFRRGASHKRKSRELADKLKLRSKPPPLKAAMS
jgi:hypothetical protein